MGDNPAEGAKGKLKNTFNTLKAFGGKVGDAAINVGGKVGGTVANAAGSVAKSAAQSGRNVVGAVKDIPHGGQFGRIKTLNQLARDQPGKDRKYSERDWAEAERKADEVLSQLYEGYFQEEFDPVHYQLQQLTGDAGPEEIEAVVEQLTVGVEKVTGKLARHVFKKREQLLHGIEAVGHVEDDIKAAFMIVRGSRGSLEQAGAEVLRNMSVVRHTRRKRQFLELIAVCSKINRARTLQQSLKRAQELGEYGEAVLLCFEGFQIVEGLKDFKVATELRATVQRLYVDTLGRVDGALTVICAEFEPQRYSKVLEAYMLLGMQGSHLAEKVMQSFVEAACDATLRVVRSLVMTKPSVVERLSAGGSLEGSYAELCSRLPVDLLRPCLLRLMEVLYDILASYHVMARWHMDFMNQQMQQQQQQQQQQEKQQGGAGEEGAQQQQQQQQDAIFGFLSSVEQVLATSRSDLFELALLRVTELLNTPGTFSSDGFAQVVELERRFLAAGEAFVGSEATELRAAFSETSCQLFDMYHQSNMEKLSTSLHNERWTPLPQPALDPSIQLEACVLHSPAYTPSFNSEGAVRSFDDWLLQGNPFAKSAAGTQRQQAMVGLLRGKSAQELLAAGEEPEPAPLPAAAPWEGPHTTGTSAAAGESPGSAHTAAQGGGWGSAGHREGTRSEAVASSSAATGGSRGQQQQQQGVLGGGLLLTASAAQALRTIKVYGQLMRPLAPHSGVIFHSMCEVFDSYLLSCFILFAGTTLETLVFQDDIIPTRLRSTIMRILTMPNSRYKAAVDELLLMKPSMSARPSPSAASTGISFLDRFATKMESLATDLERSVDRMHQRLNDRVQNMQMPAAISSIAGELASAVERVNALGGGAASGQLSGLHERIAASESLMHMAEELKAGRQALAAAVPLDRQREVEAYFAPTGTVEAAQDLRDTLFRGAARKLMAGLLDEERGVAQLIAITNYNLREPLTAPSTWASHAVRAYSQLKDMLGTAGQLPQSAVAQVWEHAVSSGCGAILDGLCRIKRCSFEGRASMGYDLAHVERAVRALAPPGFSGSFRRAEAYIKAFYLPWEELTRWCQVHLAEYGRYRISALVEIIADAYKVGRAQKAELLARIEQFSKEFSQL